MATVAGNRRRLHAHERQAAAALAVAYGLHPAVKEWARRIPTVTVPTDPNLTQSVFAFRAGLAGYRFTATGMIAVATAEAARMGRADALLLVGATQDLNDAPFYGDAGSSGDVANGIDLIANDAPHRLAAALMARLGLGGYLTAAQQVIAATLGRVLLANREQIAAAYRAAQHDVYASTVDVMGWVWISELSPFTCGYCYAQHGTWHADSDIMETHVWCSCVMTPSTLSAAEYAASVPVLGVEIFAALPSSVQRTILGPSRHDLYRSGMSLEAMVGPRGLLPVHQLRRLA